MNEDELRTTLIAFDNADKSTDATALKAFQTIENHIIAREERLVTMAGSAELQQFLFDWGGSITNAPYRALVNRIAQLTPETKPTTDERSET